MMHDLANEYGVSISATDSSTDIPPKLMPLVDGRWHQRTKENDDVIYWHHIRNIWLVRVAYAIKSAILMQEITLEKTSLTLWSDDRPDDPMQYMKISPYHFALMEVKQEIKDYYRNRLSYDRGYYCDSPWHIIDAMIPQCTGSHRRKCHRVRKLIHFLGAVESSQVHEFALDNDDWIATYDNIKDNL